jgi:hypothetical protein
MTRRAAFLNMNASRVHIQRDAVPENWYAWKITQPCPKRVAGNVS